MSEYTPWQTGSGKKGAEEWRLAAVFRTFFDPDYARSAQK